ncbi:MAG: hypothetical protein E6R03_17200 [Hyphomicrobiaceae bacterium]|nr:MAG: hypothetical protein E6R03_17200 [Hyphomicrobiaceae bacterium]
MALTSGVTGVLPVANGGTGISSLTANRIPYGNGTSAFQSSANLTYNGSRFAAGTAGSTTDGVDLNGYVAATLGSPVISATFRHMRFFATPTTATNNISYQGIYYGGNISNDGTPTGGSSTGIIVENSVASPTRLSNYTGGNFSISSTSPNVDVMYGTKVTLTDWTTTSSLDNRTGLNFDVDKRGDAVDMHTGRGIQGRVRDQSSTGRWSAGYGADLQVQNALSGTGALVSLLNSRGTGNSQTGLSISNTVSGSGVTVSNAYGILLSHSESSSGAFTNYYGIISTVTPAATTNYGLYFSGAGWRNYLNGSLALGTNDNSAQLFIRGTGATSGTDALIVENSGGTDGFRVRDDGMSSFGPTAPSSTVRLTVRGSTADNTAKGLDVTSSSGTSTLGVRNDGAVSINNAAFSEKLTVNGKVQSDGLVLTSQADVTTAGNLIYNNASTNSGYFTIGDDSRAMAFIPAMIEREIIPWAVDWTTGRKGAFWTVPARFDGWKISKAYIEVSSVGAGAGDDVLEIEIGGVTEGTQTITAGSHTLVMDDVINTDDIITFNPTSISATPAKGLNVSLELSKQ